MSEAAAQSLSRKANGVESAREKFARLYNAGELRAARRLALREREGATGDLALAWRSNLALTFRAEGHLDIALDIYDSCAGAVSECRDLEVIAKYHTGLARLYEHLADRDRDPEFYDKAIIECEAARFHYEQINDPFALSIDNNIALLLIRLGRTAEAHELLARARAAAEGASEFGRVAEMDDTRALAYEAEGDLINAHFFSSRAVNSLLGTDERRALGECLKTEARIVERLNARPEGDRVAEAAPVSRDAGAAFDFGGRR